MNKKEAAIIGAYTGILIGDFDDLHIYIEQIMNGPVFTHQLGNKEFMEKVKEAAKPDFLDICQNLTEQKPAEMSAAEALYGFAGWLTCREEKTVMSANDDASSAARLVDMFCKENKLADPRDGWADNLVHPCSDSND